MQRCENCNDPIPPDAFRERICEPCEDETGDDGAWEFAPLGPFG